MLKVLIADDEITIRTGIRKILQSYNLDLEIVAEASDGELALELAKKHQPDLLLVDINMPFLSGLSFIEKIRNDLPDALTIIISGYDEFKYAQKAIRLGVQDYLLKPINRQKLFESISSAIDIYNTKSEENENKRLSHPGSETSKPYVQLKGHGEEKQLIKNIEWVINYIENHYSDPNLTLQQIADQYYVSPSYLTRIMRQKLGLSFIEYVTEVRLKKAIELLTIDDDEIYMYQIAKSVGYNSQHYFSRIFKNKIGMSPKEYRKMNQ